MKRRDCFVANISEPFLPFLRRETDPARRNHMIAEEHALSERTALWGGVDKICLLPQPPHTIGLLESRFGYRVSAKALETPDDRLSRAITRSDDAIAWLAAAGRTAPLALSSYAATEDFVDLVATLRSSGVDFAADDATVSPEGLSVLRRIESKSGFRQVAAVLLNGLPCRLPAGTTCESPGAALGAARRLSRATGAVMIKADDGEGGFGNVALSARELERIDTTRLLEVCPFLGLRSVVEQLIPCVGAPSVEFFVPSAPRSPVVTYACTQIFDRNNYFIGVRLSPADRDAAWFEPLAEFGCRLAAHLQQRGFRGHFDIDAIVTATGDLYVVEANLRRTGGTHVHDFARTVLGSDYASRVEILSRSITIPPCSPAEALRRLEPLLVDPGSGTGVLPVVVGTAQDGAVELMVFARDEHGLQETLAAAVGTLTVGGAAHG
ncbi:MULTISPECIES: hypothetical protein [Streptomyces]|uniref:ATP-grasp domain-containing protein n=1 Tax=Streptomyces stelliscabiei TaxID=146820 RepID=A0A8I0P3S6_9ACTN|nr:hypothetical protein [Streptomyces stelliscabiei]KND43903.1 hypothetical protein IQ64_15490 [Streptomyces stelliscabiei]MBE1596739.1 hypothetical protein [Streptomyces stelliscabiei]MDX2514545.1 hypothetical protein [Streptomyces stelliscabiei]MDX2551246.1 hypothetical protein [Streptomyces stelliscabiei]MDX2615288.1 hypothetical protein [Streptomyces stelliscabiei]